MLIQILYITLSVCVFGCWLFLWRQKKSKYLPAPPELPGKLPVIGHAHIFFGDTLHTWKVIDWISQESVKHGGVVTFSLGPYITAYAITDPDDCTTASNACLKKDYYYSFANPWLGDGLLTGSVPVWRMHRRMLGPAFSQQMLNGFVGVFNTKARRLADQLDGEVGRGPFDLSKYLSLNNLETICKTALGINIDEQNGINEDYETALDQILNILTKRFQKFWLHSDFIYNRTNMKKKQDEIVKVLHNMSDTVLKKRKAALLANKNSEQRETDTFKTFMDIILQLATENGLFSDREIREEVDNIIFAGHDTISTIMTYAFIMLGSYPEVQEKTYRELKTILEDLDRDLDKEDWAKFTYLDAVLKETMRLYSIAPVVARYVDTDLKLKNYTMPAGSSCILLFCGLHRHPVWGADAEEFRPERWLDPATLPENPNAFAGFSIGKRNCIGKVYAMMSMKTTITHVLRRYQITADVTKMQLKLEALLKPAFGHFVTIERRL